MGKEEEIFENQRIRKEYGNKKEYFFAKTNILIGILDEALKGRYPRAEEVIFLPQIRPTKVCSTRQISGSLL